MAVCFLFGCLAATRWFIDKDFVFGTVVHWVVDASLSFFKGFAFGAVFCSGVHPLRFVLRQRLHLWNYCSLCGVGLRLSFSKALPLELFSVLVSTRYALVYRQRLRLWNCCSLEVGRYAFLMGKGFTFGTVVHCVVDASPSFFKGFAFGSGFCSAILPLRFVLRQRLRLWVCCSLRASLRFSYRQGLRLWGCCSLESFALFFVADLFLNYLGQMC